MRATVPIGIAIWTEMSPLLVPLFELVQFDVRIKAEGSGRKLVTVFAPVL
jgi:hypothetical protein